MSHESILKSARGGWTFLRDDPVGTLLPGAVVLGLQAAGLAAIQWTWRDLTPLWLILLMVGLVAARTLIGAPFRALYLSSAAKRVERPFSPWRRAPSLAVVWLISALAEGVLVGALLIATLGPAWWLLSRGTYWGAILLATLTTVPVLIFGVGSRVLFAYASIEATAGQRPAFQALEHGMRGALNDAPAVFGILLGGEALTAIGGLLCGAGALPGSIYADLTLLHRWSSRPEAS
ncbi:MAG: hypothetical protein EA397_14730 [Deltaproteobacteria bacterium]|nr:MAG: hypothetical protein EA397_14730 [Deltaproteobacteria bacterium]